MQDFTPHDIMAIFRRRSMLFAVIFATIFTAALVFSLRWSHYRSSVTVEIEQPVIPTSVANLGKGDDLESNAGLADRRISQIQQKVTSAESLKKVIDKLNLYPGINQKLSAEKLGSIMRKKIKLNFISSTTATPAAMQKESVEQLSAIAFTLTFDYNDPQLAKLALDAIVEQFIEEEANQRKAKNEQTTSFLDEEIAALEGTISAQEKKIADFKAKYGESGPAAVMFNQQASLSNTMALQNIEAQIGAAQANISTLSGQLGGTDPYAASVEDGKLVNSPVGQLKSLQSQYASLIGKYGPMHPDVLKVKDQIATLKSAGSTRTGGADNPLYLQLSGQLSAARAQLVALTKQKAALSAQQSKFDEMLAKNPGLEKEVSQLTLDLDNAKERYRALKDKRATAGISLKLDSSNQNKLLKVIDPARVPEDTSPSRKLLILAGLFAAFIASTAAVILVELFAQCIRGENHLASVVGIAPLVAIPHMERSST